MIKAIIVDDEHLTRQGLLEYVDWKSAGIVVVGEATDGLEGLDLVKEVQPDIAICDVRMPKMDGIELAKKIREEFPNCRIIFLSGYSDTEYLKSAIKLKALDYIEKPFNLIEFQELINKTSQSIINERQKRLEEQREAMKMEKSRLYFKNSLIAEVLKGGYSDINKLREALELLNIEFPFKGDYLCGIFRSQYDIEQEKILEVVNSYGVRSNIYFISGSIDKDVVVLFSLKHRDMLREVQSYCNEVLEHLNIEEKHSITASLGSLQKSIDGMKLSHSEAKEALNSKGYKVNSRVIIYDPNKDKSIIRDIESYIQENYQESISISSIASAVYLTPQYLCKLYKIETGETVNDYITKVRIEASKVLLKDRKYKLYEISEKVGYNDANYYARVFKKITGLNPSEYRDMH